VTSTGKGSRGGIVDCDHLSVDFDTKEQEESYSYGQRTSVR